MYGASRLWPVRAKNNDLVGEAALSPLPSGAASWEKPDTPLHKQSNAAIIAARLLPIEIRKLPTCMNTRNDTSAAVFRGSAGACRDGKGQTPANHSCRALDRAEKWKARIRVRC